MFVGTNPLVIPPRSVVDVVGGRLQIDMVVTVRLCRRAADPVSQGELTSQEARCFLIGEGKHC
jgi:hypothetical protein